MWTFKIQVQFDRLNEHDTTNSDNNFEDRAEKMTSPFENHGSKKAVISHHVTSNGGIGASSLLSTLNPIVIDARAWNHPANGNGS